MASQSKSQSLAERMAPRASTPKPAAQDSAPSVSSSFRSPEGDFEKRLTVDLTVAQHKKLKLRSVNTGVSMVQILRNYIDDMTED